MILDIVRLMEYIALMLPSLDDAARLRIDPLLFEEDELSVRYQVAVLQLPQSTVSRQLKRGARLRDRREVVWA